MAPGDASTESGWVEERVNASVYTNTALTWRHHAGTANHLYRLVFTHVKIRAIPEVQLQNTTVSKLQQTQSSAVTLQTHQQKQACHFTASF